MPPLSNHLKGLIITSLGVMILSPDSLLVRLIAIDPWTLLVWRGLLQALGIAVLVFCFYGRRSLAVFTGIGSVGLVASAFFAISAILFINALSYTSVANLLIIVAAAPFFAALMSRIFLGEAVPARTWLAILTTLGGIALLLSDSLGRGAWLGDLMALGVALCLAAKFTLLRQARAINMVPTVGISGIFLALMALPLAQAVPLSEPQLFYILVMGLLVMPLGVALITLGPRYLPAPEVSLLMVLETVFGPLWVWLVLAEETGAWTLLGGAIVVTTLVVHSIAGLRQEKRSRIQSGSPSPAWRLP